MIMTTQQKAAAYDMAIERTRRMIEDYKNRGLDNYYACAKESLEKIFPELAESEDERTRKWLICYLHKQRGFLTEENHDEYNQKLLNAVAWLEKLGEQKQKIQPKFNTGDWITDNNSTFQIVRVENEWYFADDGDKICFDVAHQYYHLWTIQDAKDGDVLNSMRVQATIIFKGFADDCKHILAYCALQKGIFIKQEMLWDRDFEPASEFLENALYDAVVKEGYEWDAEKKELKKIEQNPAWSKEDEEMLNQVIEDIVKLAGPHVCYHKDVDWLKSLKERHTWKPSDKQIEALDFAADCIVPPEFCFKRKELKGLLEQLKKLMEE